MNNFSIFFSIVMAITQSVDAMNAANTNLQTSIAERLPQSAIKNIVSFLPLHKLSPTQIDRRWHAAGREVFANLFRFIERYHACTRMYKSRVEDQNSMLANLRDANDDLHCSVDEKNNLALSFLMQNFDSIESIVKTLKLSQAEFDKAPEKLTQFFLIVIWHDLPNMKPIAIHRHDPYLPILAHTKTLKDSFKNEQDPVIKCQLAHELCSRGKRPCKFVENWTTKYILDRDPALAIDLYNVVFKKQPNQPGIVHARAGFAELAIGNWQEAAKAFSTSFEREPNLRYQYRLMNPRKMAELFEKVLAEDPALPGIMYLYAGHAYCMIHNEHLAAQDHAAAAYFFDIAIEKGVKLSPAYYADAGLVHGTIGNWQRSIQLYNKAFTLKPSINPYYHAALAAVVYTKMNDWYEATRHYDVAFRSDPNLLRQFGARAVHAYKMAGNRERALEIEEELWELSNPANDDLVENYDDGVDISEYSIILFLPIPPDQMETENSYRLEDGTQDIIAQLFEKNAAGFGMKEEMMLSPRNDNREKNLLLVFGAHGSYGTLFDWDYGTAATIHENFIGPLAEQNITFKNILVETCVTGFTMSFFQPLLAEKGMIVGTISSSEMLAVKALAQTESADVTRADLEKVLTDKARDDITLDEMLDTALALHKDHQLKEFNNSFLDYLKARHASDDVIRLFKHYMERRFDLGKLMWGAEDLRKEVYEYGFVSPQTVDEMLQRLAASVDDFAKKYGLDLSTKQQQLALARSDLDFDRKYFPIEIEDIIKRCGAAKESTFVDKAQFLHQIDEMPRLVEFLHKNPFCGLLVYSQTDNKFYYEQWVDSPLGNFVARYSENDPYDSIKNNFDHIKMLYQDSGYSDDKFIAVPDLMQTLAELFSREEAS